MKYINAHVLPVIVNYRSFKTHKRKKKRKRRKKEKGIKKMIENIIKDF